METIYRFKKGSYLSGDAQAVGEELNQIFEADGAISPDAVVTKAHAKDSAMHPFFTWDNKTAANEYRLNQARHLTRNIIAVTYKDEDSEPVKIRAFTHLGIKTTENPGYYSTVDCMTDEDHRRHVLGKIRDQMRAFYRKLEEYRSYEEVKPVLDAIEWFENHYIHLVSEAS